MMDRSTLFELRIDLNDATKKEFILNMKLEATNHSSKVDALDWRSRMVDKTERIGFLIEATKCLSVIPASNADRKRSFSTTNRLSRGEGSKIDTETLDYLMTEERDGPSVLTVEPMKLARQWFTPSNSRITEGKTVNIRT